MNLSFGDTKKMIHQSRVSNIQLAERDDDNTDDDDYGSTMQNGLNSYTFFVVILYLVRKKDERRLERLK